MTVEIQAFIDLEQTLHDKVNGLWVKHWREIEKELNKLANQGKWAEAHKFADELNFRSIVRKSTRMARTLAEASLFLGAARIVDSPQDAVFFGNPDTELLKRGVEQWAIIMSRNAQEALRLQIHIALGDLERKHAEKKMIIKGPTLPGVGRAGTQFSQAAASLMISRLSTAGFMMQAQASGVKEYIVSEVLDGVTCGICSEMNNKRFPIDAGVAMSSAIMQATDPDSLKMIAPFPSQSAANVKRVSNMDQGQLIGAGMNLPPYHPNCRGIATIQNVNQGATLAVGLSSSGISPGRLLHSSEDLTPEQLGNRLFGDFDDLDDLFMDSILGVGAGAFFGVDDGEE